MVSAGEPLDPETIGAWREATGLEPADGYGQTETGQVTANLAGEPVRLGSMGKPLPGMEVRIVGRRAAAARRLLPHLLLPLPRRRALRGRVVADRRPGHRRRRRLPLLRGPQRRHHQLLRLPDRPDRGRGRAPLPPRRRRRRRGRRPRPRARQRRPRDRRPPRRRARRRPRPRAAATTAKPRPPPTRPPASSTSSTSCRRRPAARSSAPSCAAEGARDDRRAWARRRRGPLKLAPGAERSGPSRATALAGCGRAPRRPGA